MEFKGQSLKACFAGLMSEEAGRGGPGKPGKSPEDMGVIKGPAFD